MKRALHVVVMLSLLKGISLKRQMKCSKDAFPTSQNYDLLYDTDPEINLFWNESSLSATEYVKNYCGSRCSNSEVIPQFIFKLNVHCLECECRRPACEIYDICCEELSQNLTVSNNSSVSYKPPKLGCDSESNLYLHFLYIRSCPENYHDNEEVKRLCQEDVGVNDTTVETYARVLDSDTQVVYYNSYCAMCNQVQKPVQLTLNPECSSYMLVYMAENINDFIRLMLLDSEHCTIYQQFEVDVRPFQCYEGQYSEKQVNHCGKNNSAIIADPYVVEACNQFTSNTYQVYDILNEVYYKNIFCYICDSMSYPYIYNGFTCVDNMDVINRFLYSMLINFRDEATIGQKSAEKRNICNETSWALPNGQCLQLKCSPGKILTNGTCTSIFNQITGLGYRVKALLVFEGWDKLKDSRTANDLLDMAKEQISRDLINISDGFSIQLGVVEGWNYQNASENIAPVLCANVFILASLSLNRDSFENTAMDIFFNDSHSYTNNTNEYELQIILTEDQFTHYCGDNISWSKSYNVLQNPTLDIAMSLGIEHSIPLASTLTCGFITFQQFTINFNKSNPGQGVTVTLDLGGTSVIISDISDINTLEVTNYQELHVCRELLDRYSEMYTNYNRDYISLMVQTQIVLTYVCMGASELCLLMTLVTYLCFSELRTAPGINNMFLSLSLLLAQLALVVASNISEPSYFCTLIGIATHSLWLWHFSWSFLCSFRMFHVFTSKIRTHSKNNTDIYIHLFKQLAFSLSVPAVIVSTVIISSYITSQTIGYGRYSCYLDSTFLIGVSLIGPLCLVSLCNLTFLVVTVSSIHRVNRQLTFDSIKADQFKNLTIYIKLSTVTGAHWMVAIVAEALDNDILRFVSICLNGLQGVAIFVSYTFNKRVYKLFSTRTSSSRPTSAPSSSETVLS